jgi:Fe2+ or Zn2+ uptake regulation protein
VFEDIGAERHKPTAIRMLVLKVMIETEQAVSLLDLENKLDTVDKSTIFRTITLLSLIIWHIV